jgi:hypothetical protein
MMLAGRAIGGPRDGVRLEAHPTWDGRILIPSKAAEHRPDRDTAPDDRRGRTYHPGRYAWDSERSTWAWVNVETPDAGTPR